LKGSLCQTGLGLDGKADFVTGAPTAFNKKASKNASIAYIILISHSFHLSSRQLTMGVKN